MTALVVVGTISIPLLGVSMGWFDSDPPEVQVHVETFTGWLEVEVDAHDTLPGVGTVQIELAGRPIEGSTDTWGLPDGEALLEVTVRDTSWSRNGTHIERRIQIDNRRVGPMPPAQQPP